MRRFSSIFGIYDLKIFSANLFKNPEKISRAADLARDNDHLNLASRVTTRMDHCVGDGLRRPRCCVGSYFSIW